MVIIFCCILFVVIICFLICSRSTPLELRNITEKIDSGEILELPDLQVKLFMMYMNTVMLNVNKSNPVEADVATNFILHELPRNCPVCSVYP